MTKGVIEPKNRHDRVNAIHEPYGRSKRSVEQLAAGLRLRLHLPDLAYLPHEDALALIPDCEVRSLKSIRALPFQHLNHLRTDGLSCGGLAFTGLGGGVTIVFNDAHPPPVVRVNLMEEFFHIWLGHPPDVVRWYSVDGRHRTYDPFKEDQAYGCAIAALVPRRGLGSMLNRGAHIARIAEHYLVPVEILELRIATANLGHLALPRTRRDWSIAL
jgi:Zn-dependent peptidase ImmA (M78 family)